MMQLASLMLQDLKQYKHVRATASATQSQSISIQSVTTLTVNPADEISAEGYKALKYIAASSKLSPEEKRTLIRLVALVDQYAGGDPKLMRDVLGVAAIMEAGRKEGTYPRHSMQEAMDAYWEEREKLGGRADAEISVATEITVTRIEAERLSVEISAEIGQNAQ